MIAAVLFLPDWPSLGSLAVKLSKAGLVN